MTKAKSPRSLPRRVLRTASKVSLALLLLLIVTYLLRGMLFGRLVASAVTDAVAAELGGTYTIDRVAGGWISDVELVGFRTRTAPTEGSVRDLAFERARVRFSLWQFLSDPATAVRGVDVEGLELVLDARSRAAPDSEAASQSLAEVLASIPRPLPELDIQGTLLLRSEVGDWRAGSLRITARGTEVALDLDRVASDFLGETGTSRLRGTLVWDQPTTVSWRSSDAIGGVTLTEAVLRAGPGGTWRVEAKIDVAGGAVEGFVSDADHAFDATALDLARLSPWIRALAGDAERHLPRSGIVDARVAGDSAGVRGNFVARDLAWADHVADRVSAELSWGGGRLAIAVLDAAGAGVTVTARNVVIDPAAPLVVTGAEQLTAKVLDLGVLATRLGLDDLARRLPPRPVGLEIRVQSPSPGRVEVETLTIDAGASSVNASGTVTLPDDADAWRSSTLGLDVQATAALDDLRRAWPGEWWPNEVAGSIRAEARLDGTVDHPRVGATVAGAGLRLGGHDVESLSAAGEFESGVATISRIDLVSPFADAHGRGAVELATGTLRDLRVEVDARDLAAVSRAFPALPAMSGSLRAEGSLSGVPPGGLRGALTLRGARVGVLEWDLGAIDVAATFDGARIALERLAVEGPLASLSAKGSVDMETGAIDLPAFRAYVPDLQALTKHLDGAPRLAGALRAQGSVRRAPGAPWEAVDGDIEIEGADLRAFGLAFSTFAAHATARSGEVDVAQFAARGDFGELVCAGTLRLDGDVAAGTLRQLELRRERGAATLVRPVELRWSEDALDVAAFEVLVPGLGAITGSASLSEDSVVATLDGTDVDLSFLSARATGRAMFHLDVRGPRDAPEGTLSLESPRLSWDGETASVSIGLTQDARGVRIDRLLVDAGEFLQARGEGHAPVRVGWGGLVRPAAPPPARLALRLVSSRPERWISLVSDEPVSAESVELTIDGNGPDLTADLRVRELRWNGIGGAPVRLPDDTVMHAEVRSGGTSLRVQSSPGGPLTVDGEIRSPSVFDWTDPVRAADALRAAQVEGRLDLDVADLSAILQWLPGVRHLSGRAQGQLTLGGTVGAPSWGGLLRAQDVAVLVPGDVAPFDQGTAVVRMDGDRILVETLTGRLGYGAVNVSGQIELSGATPHVELKLAGRNVLLVRSHHLRLRADVEVDLSGPLDAPAIAGSVRVTRGLYTRPMDLLGRGSASPDQSFQLFSLRGDPFARAQLDVAVSADRTVRVENDLLEADLSLDLHLRGTGEVPQPVGTVTFHGARVTLPFTNLEVERGELRFEPGNPFAPTIRALARASVKGYDLSVALTGNVPDVEVRVASSPPLSQASARLLLATGATPTELERDGIAGAALSRAGTFLGGAALSWIRGGSGGRGDSIADRVRVEVGRDESEGGLESVTAEFRLAERWYLVAERDRYEDYNMGIVWRLRFR